MTSTSKRPAETGFTLIELLVAVAITLLLVAVALELLRAGEVTFVTEPEAVDLQQRVRVVADTLTRDLIMAGAGFSRGSVRGLLATLVAPVIPYRTGLRSADAPGSFFSDRLTLLYVPCGAPEAVIGDPITSANTTIHIVRGPGCGLVNQACGFQAGMAVLVVDEGGRSNLFTVDAVTGDTVDLQLRDPALAAMFQAGAHVAAATVESYSLKIDAATRTFQLLEYDGYRSEQPVSDDIVGLQVEYFGDPAPPAIVRPLTDPDGPWTTYGPKPPPIGVDDPQDSWPAGENCTFSVQNGVHVPRLAAFGRAEDALVPLGAAVLTDGPWCPDGLAPNRFDADLLRIRRVRVSIRAQVPSVSLRGAGPLFARPGTSRGGGRSVPDAQVTIDVAPRNLNAGR
jgi:prepilin-type N-terminal cleavage/methylation domain-containing protein